MTIKVLIVDDSATVRKVLTDQLSMDPEIEVIGTAPDPYIARDKIVMLKPDIITLDIEMPRMDGLTFLSKLMSSHPIPTIVFSSLTPAGGEMAMKAYSMGALDVICKPQSHLQVGDMGKTLREKIKVYYKTKPIIKNQHSLKIKPTTNLASLIKTTNQIITIGASTGGTKAIESVLESLPVDAPGIVIVQHMPEHFTKSFADRLNSLCNIKVKEAEKGDHVTPGIALIAPGNMHMLLERSGTTYYIKLKDGPMIHHQKPAVDVLFKSVAKTAGINSIGILLTGMGKDGAEGLLEMKNSGAKTIAEAQESCIVFGMPREAIELDAAQHIVRLEHIPNKIFELLKQSK